MTKEIDQRAQRHDPASQHTRDSNDRPDSQTMQPGRSAGPNDEDGERFAYDPDKSEGDTSESSSDGSGTRDVRPAGRDDMKNPPKEWRKEDEEGDESFPASDPPANY